MNRIVEKLSRKKKSVKKILKNAKYSINKKILDCYDTATKKFSDSCFNIAKVTLKKTNFQHNGIEISW